MMNRRFLLWFSLAILLVIVAGATAYILLKNKSAAASANGALVVGIETILVLIAMVGLIRLVIIEHKSRIKAELMLNEKYDELNHINKVTNTANLLLNGLREVNNSLMGNDNVSELVNNCLETITNYLKAPCAVCYLFESDQHLLVRAGSIALATGMNERIKLGEGITGAAANRKTVTVIHDIPTDYWRINSGSGTARPDTLIILPLWKGSELIGVIELGCFGKDASGAEELLREMSANIALGLSAARLLSLTQEQRDVLEVQQEELRQTNNELSMQAEELRASEEDLKVQEEELIKMNLELEEKTESLEIARSEMQQKAEALEQAGKYKSEFLANMSHELRTPLNSILILTSLMKEDKQKNLSPKQLENLGIVYNSGTDLLNLINDILDLSKIEAGKADFHFEQVPIRHLADDMQNMFKAVATNKHIVFNVTFDRLMHDNIVTDRQRLGQVLKNLLSNAFKFTPNKGSVMLDFATTDGGGIAISVSDTGVGIPQDKQELIFNAFQQADGATTRRYGGTGLGLSISKELVSRLGGNIRLQSTEGKGSIFTVSLPLQHSAIQYATKTNILEDSIAVPKDIQVQTQVKDDRQGLIPQERAVLIIEDDVNFARTVNDFATQKGFKTIIALSGDEGLQYARQYRPSAIILDLALPVFSGQHILKIIKSDHNLRHIPVHVISAYDGSDIVARDVASYVQKPINQLDLEHTFESIETYISQHYRKALVLCNPQSPLKELFATAATKVLTGLVYELTENREHALELVKAGKADCLIADCSGQAAEEAVVLKEIRDTAPDGLYVITYVNRSLSEEEIKQFSSFSDTVIGASTQANKRLLDEIELFLKKVSENPSLTSYNQTDTAFGNILKDKTILIADDDMRNIFALSALLEAHEMKVLTAEHGREAIEMLQQHPEIDLVLMDIMMPEMSGYEAMSLIRKNNKYARLPLIALTAKAMLGDREKCLAAGASDYITKPVDNNKLLSLLKVWLAYNV